MQPTVELRKLLDFREKFQLSIASEVQGFRRRTFGHYVLPKVLITLLKTLSVQLRDEVA